MKEEKINIKDREDEFYSKKIYLSYSALSKMMYSPSLYYRHYVLQQREERLENYLIDGKVIHCLLLEDGSFDKQFILMPDSLPGDSIRKVVDKVYDLVKEGPGLLENYNEEILEILKEINLHQSLKTDEQRIVKIVTEESKSYFEFLKIKNDKILLDSITLQRCSEAVDAVKNNSKACTLLGIFKHEMDKIDIFNEIPLEMELKEHVFGLKGILDNIKVDYDTKKVFVNDLKTTGKTITDFEETVNYYNYWAQAAVYMRLVKNGFEDLLKDGDWSIEFNFIVVDKYNQVYAFSVKPETMKKWDDELEARLSEFEWHYREKNYTLPYKFMSNQVML